MLPRTASADGYKHLSHARSNPGRSDHLGAMEFPADLPGVHIHPERNPDTFTGKGSHPGPSFQACSGKNYLLLPFQKTYSQVVRFTGTKGLR